MKTIRIQWNDLSSTQEKMRRKLMRNKFYKHPDQKRLPILLREFIPTNHESLPLVLLCQFGPRDKKDRFEYVIFVDGLYGPKHYPSDSFGYGTEKAAREHFKDVLVSQVTGIHEWVYRQVVNDAKMLAHEMPFINPG